MAKLESALKDTAVVAIGALAGGVSIKYLAGFLKSKIFMSLFGVLVIIAGAYIDHEILGEFLIGFGAPYVAMLLI